MGRIVLEHEQAAGPSRTARAAPQARAAVRPGALDLWSVLRLWACLGLLSLLILAFATHGSFAAGLGAIQPRTADDDITGAISSAEAKPPAAARKSASGVPLRRMIGQMLMIGFPGTELGEAWPQRAIAMVREGKIGGVLLLSYNVRSPGQLKRLTGALRDAGGPMRTFIAVDQEGGAVQRMTAAKGFMGLPSAAEVARTADPISAYQLYDRQARELRANGINVNFGPVVDLAVNPANPIITRLGRSYGRTPAAVMPYATAFINAHEKAGILTSPKHFPGHGSSTSDPHEAVTDITGLWKKQELQPFTTLIRDRKAEMIMVGHLVLDGYSDDGAPTSLSHTAVTQKLREQMGFNGLIVTDDLDMNAVRSRYTVEEAFIRAIAAGNDIVIDANKRAPDPQLVDKVTDAIVAAVESGRLDRAQIERSYKRILLAKGGLAELQLAKAE